MYNKPYGMVLSLGGTRHASYQIQNALGYRIANVFDEIVTPLEDVEKVILRGVCASVVPRNEDEQDEFALQRQREAYARKYNAFAKLVELRKRTLFVRFGGHHGSDIAKVDERPTTTEDLNALCAAIDKKFPGLWFTLAFVWVSDMTPVAIVDEELDPRVSRHELSGYGKNWLQDTTQWAGILSRYKIDIKETRNGPLESYSVIASLGSWCAPAWNIREYYNTREARAAKPFDWWVFPLAATIKVLQDGFANIFKLENLKILDGATPRETVQCQFYGIGHHHDFKRENDAGKAEDGYHSASPIDPDLASQMESVRQKFTFILNRFKSNTVGADVLMVRHEHSITSEDALKLYDAFVGCFNPRTLDLLFLTTDGKAGGYLQASRGIILFEPLGTQMVPSENFFWQKNYTAVLDKIGTAYRHPITTAT